MEEGKVSTTELIEINLMFAQLDLSMGKNVEGATARALDHIQEALRHMRAELAGRPADEAQANPPTGERSAV